MDPKQVPSFTYDDICKFMYDGLIAHGYVPTSDEVLDVSWITMEYVIMILENLGMTVLIEGE